MRFQHRHNWNLNPEQAIALQRQMVTEVIYNRPLDLSAVQLVAGVDVSVKENISQAAVVVVSFPDLKPVETVLWRMPTPFPYVPGLLSFREGPVLVEAFERLKHEPDVGVVERRLDAAAHRIRVVSASRHTWGCGCKGRRLAVARACWSANTWSRPTNAAHMWIWLIEVK